MFLIANCKSADGVPHDNPLAQDGVGEALLDALGEPAPPAAGDEPVSLGAGEGSGVAVPVGTDAAAPEHVEPGSPADAVELG